MRIRCHGFWPWPDPGGVEPQRGGEGCRLQIVRDWVLRFSEGGPDGLITRKVPGRASILNDGQRAGLGTAVEAGSIPAAHDVVRWRLADLAQWIHDEFKLSVTRHTLGRELRAMSYRKLTARARHHDQRPASASRPSLPGAGPGAKRAPRLSRISDGHQHVRCDLPR